MRMQAAPDKSVYDAYSDSYRRGLKEQCDCVDESATPKE